MGNGMSEAYGSSEATTAGNFYTDALNSAKNNKDPKTLGKLFEGIFYHMLLKPMEESAEEDPLFGSHAMGHASSLYYDEVANKMGEVGQLNIAEIITADLEKHQGNHSKASGLLKESSSFSRKGNHYE